MRSTDYREAAQKIQKYINTMYQTIVKGVGRGVQRGWVRCTLPVPAALVPRFHPYYFSRLYRCTFLYGNKGPLLFQQVLNLFQPRSKTGICGYWNWSGTIPPSGRSLYTTYYNTGVFTNFTSLNVESFHHATVGLPISQ